MPLSAKWWEELRSLAEKHQRETLHGDELVEVCNKDKGFEADDFPPFPPGGRVFYLTRLLYEGQTICSGWRGSRQKARRTFVHGMGRYLTVGLVQHDDDVESVMSDASHLSTLADLDEEPSLTDSEAPVELRAAESFYNKEADGRSSSSHSGGSRFRAPLAELNQDSQPKQDGADMIPPKRRRRLGLFGGLQDVEQTPPPVDEREPEEEEEGDVNFKDDTEHGEEAEVADDDEGNDDDAEFQQILAQVRRNRPSLEDLIGPPPAPPAPPAVQLPPPVQQQQAQPAVVLPPLLPPGPAQPAQPLPAPAALLQALLPAGADLRAVDVGRDLLAILRLLVSLATPTPLSLAKTIRRLTAADVDGIRAGAAPVAVEMGGIPSKTSLNRTRSALGAGSKLLHVIFYDGFQQRTKAKSAFGHLSSLCSVYAKVLGRGRLAGEGDEPFAARMGRVAGAGLAIVDDLVSAAVVKKAEPAAFRGHVAAAAAAAFASRLLAVDLGAERAAVAALIAHIRAFLLSPQAH